MPNQQPVRLTALACARAGACIVGLFERFWCANANHPNDQTHTHTYASFVHRFIYWRQMDDAFCWWRWVEYSASASVMALSIAIAIGIREMNTLASIFMLHFTTMCFGLLVEYISVPKAMLDTVNYQYPIGPMQVAEFAKAGRLASDIAPYGEGGNTDYRRDPRALKVISQDQWELERPVYDIQDTAKVLGKESDYFVQAQRTNNYIRCNSFHTDPRHEHGLTRPLCLQANGTTRSGLVCCT